MGRSSRGRGGQAGVTRLGGQFAVGGGRVAAGPSKQKAGRAARIAAAKEALSQKPTGSVGHSSHASRPSLPGKTHGPGAGGINPARGSTVNWGARPKVSGGHPQSQVSAKPKSKLDRAKEILGQKVAREGAVKQFNRSTKTMEHVKVGSAGHNPHIKPDTVLKRPASAGSGSHPSSPMPGAPKSPSYSGSGGRIIPGHGFVPTGREPGHVVKGKGYVPSEHEKAKAKTKRERAKDAIDHQIGDTVKGRAYGHRYTGEVTKDWGDGDMTIKRRGKADLVINKSTVAKNHSAEAREKWRGSATGHKDTEAAHKTDAGWKKERVKEVHEKYTESVTKGLPTSKTPTVYMTGGGPASGKSTGLLENPKTGIPKSDKAAHVDPDGAKKHIPEYNAGVAAKDKTAAAFVHEESSHMAKSTMNGALTNGHDVVYDSVGDSGYKKLSGKVAEMRANGAKNIEAHYATVDVDEAIRRSDSRAAKTGRFVPHEYIREAHRDVSRTFRESVKEGLFDKADLWDTGGKQGDAPKHVASYTKSGGLKIHDKDAWSAFEERGK
jgi:hypothetical protein